MKQEAHANAPGSRAINAETYNEISTPWYIPRNESYRTFLLVASVMVVLSLFLWVAHDFLDTVNWARGMLNQLKTPEAPSLESIILQIFIWSMNLGFLFCWKAPFAFIFARYGMLLAAYETEKSIQDVSYLIKFFLGKKKSAEGEKTNFVT